MNRLNSFLVIQVKQRFFGRFLAILDLSRKRGGLEKNEKEVFCQK